MYQRVVYLIPFFAEDLHNHLLHLGSSVKVILFINFGIKVFLIITFLSFYKLNCYNCCHILSQLFPFQSSKYPFSLKRFRTDPTLPKGLKQIQIQAFPSYRKRYLHVKMNL